MEVTYGFSRVESVLQRRISESSALAPLLHAILNSWQVPTSPRGGMAPRGAVCFCTERDLLSQWRGYGQFGVGYAVGFDFLTLNVADQAAEIVEVIYEEDEQEKLIIEVLDEADRIAKEISDDVGGHLIKSVFTQLYLYSLRFKQPTFKGEMEWRLIYWPSQINFETGRLGPEARCGFRVGSRNVIVPYYPYPIRKPDGTLPIAQVVVGPGIDFVLARDSLQHLFSRHNQMVLPSIEPSRITLRY